MSEMHSPNLAAELLRIHSIITRGLQVAMTQSRLFAAEGYSDAVLQEGFISFVRSFVSVLDAHHSTEDEVAFPHLRTRFPDAPYNLLMGQHQSLAPMLEQIKAVIDEMVAHVQDRKLLDDLHRLLIRIDEFWHPHIRIEEDYFTVEKVGAEFPSDEQIRLIQLCMEHSQKHSGPDYLVAPFLLYNLPPEQRSIFAKGMPPIVTEQLVPGVWKEKWAPMKPFLLS
jgi:hemerythrin-like domain-containing protein